MLIAPMQLPLTRRSDKRWLKKNFIVEKVCSVMNPACVVGWTRQMWSI